MATITWEVVSVRCGKDDNVTMAIRELSDGSPTDNEYSVRLHKDRPVGEFKAVLKKIIVIDRAESGKADVFSGKLDFSDFEDYINKK